MFGRRRREQQQAMGQARNFAWQTINAKQGLIRSAQTEITSGLWFENGQHPSGRAALENYLEYLISTDDVVFLTVNSLPDHLRARAESVAPSILQTLTYPHSAIGLGGNPAYYAHNELQRDLFGVDPFSTHEGDREAADATIAMGFMRACADAANTPDDVFAQTVVVACTLGAGWVASVYRGNL